MPNKTAVGPADLSDDDRRQLLSRAVSAQAGPNSSRYVRDVYPSSLVYKDYDTDALYRCDYSIADDLSVTLGTAEAVLERTVYEPVTMSADGAYVQGGARVYPQALLFRAGDYADKGFSLTPDELKQIAVSYAPGAAQVNLQHAPAMLAGKLGQVRRVWAGEGGQALFGEVAIPTWLDDQLTDDERRVSCEFDRTSKALIGLALTPTPRVADAALMAAFQAANPQQDSSQDSSKEQTTVDNTTDKQTATDSTKKPNALFSALKALFTRDKVTEADVDQALGSVDFSVPDPAEISRLQREVATLRGAGTRAQAEAFADAELRAGRALPAERAALVAAFAQAAEDDAAAPRTVTFAKADGAEATGTRVDALKALYAGRTPHKLADELLDDTTATAAQFSAGGTQISKRTIATPTEVYARRAQEASKSAR